MSYDPQEGVLPVMVDAMRDSQEHTQGADPVDAPFLRCVAEYGCPGHGGKRNDG